MYEVELKNKFSSKVQMHEKLKKNHKNACLSSQLLEQYLTERIRLTFFQEC